MFYITTLLIFIYVFVVVENQDSFFNVAEGNIKNDTTKVPLLVLYAPRCDDPTRDPSTVLQEGRNEVLATLQFAEKVLRRRGLLDDSIVIDYHMAQTDTSCEYYSAIGHASEIYFQQVNFTAVIGPVCTINLQPLALWSTYYNIPMFSYVATDVQFSDKTIYQTLARVSANHARLTMAVSSLLQWYKWNTVAIVYQHGTSSCDLMFNTMPTMLYSYGFNVALTIIFDASAVLNDTVYNDTLLQIRKSARIVLACFSFDPATARPFMLAAHRNNMTNGDYVFILTWALKTTIKQPYPWLNRSGLDGLDNFAKEAYRSVLLIEPEGTDELSLATFNQIIEDMVTVPPYNVPAVNYTTSPYRVTMYDAMYLFGVALNQCALYDPLLYKDGKAMFNCSVGQVFPGAATPVVMGGTAERIWGYTVRVMDSNDNFTEMLYIKTIGCDDESISVERMAMTLSNDDIPELSAMPKPKIYSFTSSSNSCQTVFPLRTEWFLGGLIVRDVPVCGFDGKKCVHPIVDKSTITIVSVLVAILLLLAASFAGYIWRNRRMQLRNLQRYQWRISMNDLRFFSNNKNAFHQGSMISMTAPIGSIYGSVNASEPAEDLKLALYREQVVVARFIKRRLPTRKLPFEFNREELTVIKCLKDVQHENLNIFFGMVMDSSELVVLWSHCSRRDLETMLINSDVDLDHVFKSSILRDIVMGLDYIHKSPLGHHGLLSTKCCVITNRWVVRLTDYGLDQLLLQNYEQNILIMDGITIQRMTASRAPEIRKQGTYAVGTKAGDIYSFGTIMFEVLFRDITATEKSQALAAVNKLIDEISTMKPNEATSAAMELNETSFGKNVLQLIKDCWNETPSQRPVIQTVKQTILKETRSSKNLVDHMFSMMEKYAANLENVVEERTQQLQEERTRAERLLYEMLPKCIADDLKNGRPIVPEEFDSATVYFSDIVGFTVICSESSPIEVIDMLNSLYQQFDEIIFRYDCYKVETIGDAYLVVSGVPKRNGGAHAARISEMAIDIRSLVGNNFIVPHLPPERNRVSIRIGIHSGPVAAGVIGLSMPRFCLFGDTVNVASRMESHGLPMKIQASHPTFLLLQENKKFQLTPRGEVEVKGKGSMSTYWVDRKL